MTWQAWFTLAAVLALVIALVREIARVDVIVLTILGVLLIAGVVTPAQAFSGFSDPAVVTVAALYIVAAGIHRTGVLTSLDALLTPTDHRLSCLLIRTMAPTAVISAFLNNTPVVAMLMPRLQSIADRTGIAPSKILMPLSFAAIAGGMATLIGTSTNLIASGLLREAGFGGFELFEFAWIGIPVALFTIVYMAFVGHKLLPDRRPETAEDLSTSRDYQFEMRVQRGSGLVGKSISEANLRSLGDAYLVHMQRDGHLIAPASPDEILLPRDVLTFSGKTSAMQRLLEQTDLKPNIDGPPLNDGVAEIPLFEAVVSATSDLVGKTLKEVGFREKYQGVVLAIHRQDELLRGALGNIPIKPGDLLVVEARRDFERNWNQSQGDFYMVTPKSEIQHGLSKKAPIALLLLFGMVALNVTGILPLAAAAFAAALGMVLLGCLRGQELRKSIDVTVMLTIAGMFGLGKAVEASGLAGVLGHSIAAGLQPYGPLLVVAALYLVTVLLTELITNNAAVVVMLPIAIATAVDLGVDVRAVALIVTIAASAGFLSPLGYQTHLMVMGAGGYSFKDFTRAGLPISIAVMAITLTVAYLKWLG
ncbi:MAG: SLC13 family permease [Rhodothermales bacterium]